MPIARHINNFVMGVSIMESSYEVRNHLISQIQEEFNKLYPYLKVVFRQQGNSANALPVTGLHSEEQIRDGVRSLLEKDIHLMDGMKVSELEDSLEQLFGQRAQVFRRSGNFWMDTQLSRGWTLKQQNDHGQDISSGFL